MRFLLLAAILISPSALTATTICNIEGKIIGPKTVSWDTVSGKAKIRTFSNEVHQGKVTLVRQHGDGLKVNLVFETEGTPYRDETEYIVFSVSEAVHRIIEVGYKWIAGVRHLDISQGNYEARCSSL